MSFTNTGVAARAFGETAPVRSSDMAAEAKYRSVGVAFFKIKGGGLVLGATRELRQLSDERCKRLA